jgi:uncharacterized membrane protein
MKNILKRFVTNRLEAFSDGVLAIIITIMVLELKVPHLEHGHVLEGLKLLLPTLSAYALSFVFVGVYWVAHHHVLVIAEQVTVKSSWANLHFMFWCSLIPFATSWLGESGYQSESVALYGALLCAVSFSFWLFVRSCEFSHDMGCQTRSALHGDTVRDLLPIVLYATSVPVALLLGSNAALVLFALVLVLWFIPE